MKIHRKIVKHIENHMESNKRKRDPARSGAIQAILGGTSEPDRPGTRWIAVSFTICSTVYICCLLYFKFSEFFNLLKFMCFSMFLSVFY